MNGPEVYAALQARGVTHLHHANTVGTSCTFLHQRGLASRGYVEQFQLHQTPQPSDDLDKKFGIWGDVFLDGVDIHDRGGMRNRYGPVLFEFPLDILLHLPEGTLVWVTKKNPVHWKDGESPNDWYFATGAELQAAYSFGDFGKHVMLRIPGGILPFGASPVNIVLDDPKRALLSGRDAYTEAEAKLRAVAGRGGVSIALSRRQCSSSCKCQGGYSGINLDAFF
jgi:hypothetical protein